MCHLGDRRLRLLVPGAGPAAVCRLSRGKRLITVSTSLWGSKYSEDQYGAFGDIRLQYRRNRDIAWASGRGSSAEEAGAGRAFFLLLSHVKQ